MGVKMSSGHLQYAYIHFNKSSCTIRFDETQIEVPAYRGLKDIAHLLRSPKKSYSVIDLRNDFKCAPEYMPDHTHRSGRDESGLNIMASESALAVVDSKTLIQVKAEIERLKEVIQLKEASGADTAHEEESSRKLYQYLRGATGYGIRSRRWATPKEKFRKAVAIRIKRAIQKLRPLHPSLAAHLKRSIRLGYDPVYLPEETIEWCVSEKSEECSASPIKCSA
jgi:hypothetical protein